MLAHRPSGPGAAALKYDLLTLLGVAGLGTSATATRSMLRLITLVTARYNWRTGELAVGRREIARLWGVDERTVKREMGRLKAAGLLVQRRPGVRGRVAVYGIDFAAALAACDCARVGPDFAARMAGLAGPVQAEGGAGEGTATVIPFPAQPLPATDPTPVSEWAAARRTLRAIGPAPFARWIEPLTRAGCAEGRLVLVAPSSYHAAFVERTYGDLIADAVRRADPAVQRIVIGARAGEGAP